MSEGLYTCIECDDGVVVSDTCDECGVRHCACEGCHEGIAVFGSALSSRAGLPTPTPDRGLPRSGPHPCSVFERLEDR